MAVSLLAERWTYNRDFAINPDFSIESTYLVAVPCLFYSTIGKDDFIGIDADYCDSRNAITRLRELFSLFAI